MSHLLAELIAVFTLIQGPTGVGTAVTLYLLMSSVAGHAL
jgi:hypothetical protein